MNKAELILAKVKQETKLTAEVVAMLAEFEFTGERERMQFSSLYAFCMDYLGYSKGSACRRVDAVALYKRDESVMEKYESGELNLTNAGKIEQTLKQAEKQGVEIPPEELYEAAQESTRTSEEKIQKVAQAHGVQSADKSSEVKELLEKLRAIWSHRYPGLSAEEINVLALREIIKQEDPAQRPACPGAGAEYQEVRYITPKLNAYIWQRDESQCVHVNPHTGQRCRETHFLQIDHEYPFALGGLTIAKNLRLYCGSHNRQHAKAWGLYRPKKKSKSAKAAASARREVSPARSSAVCPSPAGTTRAAGP